MADDRSQSAEIAAAVQRLLAKQEARRPRAPKKREPTPEEVQRAKAAQEKKDQEEQLRLAEVRKQLKDINEQLAAFVRWAKANRVPKDFKIDFLHRGWTIYSYSIQEGHNGPDREGYFSSYTCSLPRVLVVDASWTGYVMTYIKEYGLPPNSYKGYPQYHVRDRRLEPLDESTVKFLKSTDPKVIAEAIAQRVVSSGKPWA